MGLRGMLVVLAFCISCMTGVDSILCYSCQYSDNLDRIGFECVTSPADYTLGPTTTECATDCSAERQVYSGTTTVYFMTRGCKVKEDGCTAGSIEVCVETCNDRDLCNDKNYDPGTLPPTSPAPSTIPPTTTTEIPGTISCYSCVYSYHPEGDDSCVTDPPNAPPPNTVRCPPDRYCTTFYQWDKGEMVVRSFRRGCDVYTGQVDNCVEDTFFITCNTYCNTELCNSGDGVPLTKTRKIRKSKAPPAEAKDGVLAV